MNATHRKLPRFAALAMAALMLLLTGCASTGSYSAGFGPTVNCSNFKDPLLFVGKEDHNNIGIRLYGRYDPGMTERFVVEGGYTKVGDTKFDGLWQGVPDTGKIETEMVEANVGYRYPFTEKFSAGGRIGATYVDVKENENFGGTPFSASASETIPYGGIVARFAINKSWGVTAFYDHYPDVGKVGQTGEGDMEVFGVNFDFRFGGTNSDD
jgi:hypothetical protein